MDFGKTLKSTRESKDLTLQQIARELKININVLKKIELSEVDELPNPTSTKGFIRSYSTHLGIESEPLVEDYLSKIKKDTKPTEETVLNHTIDAKPFFLSEFIQKKILPVFILAIFVGLGFVAFKYLNGADEYITDVMTPDSKLKKSPEIIGDEVAPTVSKKTLDEYSVEKEAKENHSNLVESETESESESESSSDDPVKSLEKKHKLIIEPLDKTYAYYKSEKDDKFITLALKPNVRRSFAFRTAEIKFLDAGAISLIFDGKDLGSPGIFAEEKTIKFPSLEGL